MRLVILRVIGLALAGLAATPAVAEEAATFIPAAHVTGAFAKGAPLVENDRYKVHASRRDAPGVAEVHVHDTDIIYVLEGSAVIVTGGAIVEGKTVAAGEIRGPSIAGGTDQRLVKGDLFIVPNGLPHWFRDVQAPFVYYVVKATNPTGVGQ
jgi:quercetin dioxygenase-like cupin family protein